ncbi:TMEM175 family protein [Corallococcus sp. 4LFB]|uniref:TMEM175 family protein n=1 Tax=Corallococcus sp. 4LFB TaxID=3383249 RepID=UPI0039767AF7
MDKNRLEAFSDGVIAIIITIMVLELKVPHGSELADLRPLIPVFLSYVLSFVYIGIYWNNHHHLLHTISHVTGGVLWANLHLLFWLSLVPFTTGWMGENHFASVPLALYGFVLLMCAFAWWVLQTRMVAMQGRQSPLALAVGRDLKGKISSVLYLAGIVSAFINGHFSEAVYVLAAVLWLVPDRRFEKATHAG